MASSVHRFKKTTKKCFIKILSLYKKAWNFVHKILQYFFKKCEEKVFLWMRWSRRQKLCVTVTATVTADTLIYMHSFTPSWWSCWEHIHKRADRATEHEEHLRHRMRAFTQSDDIQSSGKSSYTRKLRFECQPMLLLRTLRCGNVYGAALLSQLGEGRGRKVSRLSSLSSAFTGDVLRMNLGCRVKW